MIKVIKASCDDQNLALKEVICPCPVVTYMYKSLEWLDQKEMVHSKAGLKTNDFRRKMHVH